MCTNERRRRAGGPAQGTGGLGAAVLRTAGLRTAVLRTAVLRTAVLRTAGLRTAGLGALFAGAMALGAPAPAAAQGAEAAMTDEARKLYDEGKKAKDKGDFATCVAKLRATWALKKHRQVAGMLGECELKSGANREATEHFAYFLDHASDAPADVQAAVRALYDEARAEVAVVTVKASVEGADRRVDGRPLGPDEARAFLSPGEHVFSASKAGAGTGEKKIFLSGGQEREVLIELVSEAAPPPVAPPPTPPPKTPSEGPSIVPGLVVGSAGLVALGGGLGIFATANSADPIVDGIKAGGGKCEPVTPGFEKECAAFESAADSDNTQAAVGGVVMIAGGVLLVGSVTWTIWAATQDGEEDVASVPAGRAATAPHVTLTPVLGTTPGLRLEGAFF